MASITPKKLGRGAIAVSPGTLLYTVPAATSTYVKCIDVCNTTAGALTLALYLVPSGGTVGTTNMFVPTITINAYSMWQWTGTQILVTGDFIQGIGSAAGLTCNISGGEQV